MCVLIVRDGRLLTGPSHLLLSVLQEFLQQLDLGLRPRQVLGYSRRLHPEAFQLLHILPTIPHTCSGTWHHGSQHKITTMGLIPDLYQNWVKYVIVLDETIFPRFIEHVWYTGTYEILPKKMCKRHLPVLLVGSTAPGKINRAQKSIWIQNNYVFNPGLFLTHKFTLTLYDTTSV